MIEEILQCSFKKKYFAISNEEEARRKSLCREKCDRGNE
jgi:hypothetical protein